MQRRNIQSQRKTRNVWAREERHHKLRVGDSVTLLAHAREPRSKEMKEEFETARFEITRLLPVEGHSFQYRIKDIVTGRERVVVEDQIMAARP